MKNPNKGGRIGMTATQERKARNPKSKIIRLLKELKYLAVLHEHMELACELRAIEKKYF